MLDYNYLPSFTAQIYIGDIDPACKEIDLYNLLRPFGEVSYIKLLSQGSSQKRYAFISFKDPNSAAQARTTLNGTKLLNSFIRICRVSKDRDPKANIFIKNIPATASLIQYNLCFENVNPLYYNGLKDLETRFSPFGIIISSKICCDKNGNSLRYGFLQYEKQAAAFEAIKQMNGTLWNESSLSVCEFLPISARAKDSYTNLYIKGFPVEYSQDDIKSKFKDFGEILSIGLMTANTKDGERAFGFISFATKDSAFNACKAMNSLKEENFEWFVAPHMNKNNRKAVLKAAYLAQIEEWKVKNLYIKNLPKNITEANLKEICEEYGSITSIKIAKVEHIRYSADGDLTLYSLKVLTPSKHKNTELTKEFSSKGVGFVCYSCII